MCAAAVQDLIAAAEGSKKVILACEAGGSLVPTTSFQYGKESRSLKASHLPIPHALYTLPMRHRQQKSYLVCGALSLSLWDLQAAYKAVTSDAFSDVLHLGGGVYGKLPCSRTTCNSS